MLSGKCRGVHFPLEAPEALEAPELGPGGD